MGVRGWGHGVPPSEQLLWDLLPPGRLQLYFAGDVGQNPCRPSRALGDATPKHTDATHPGIPAHAQQPGRSRVIWLPGDLARSGCRDQVGSAAASRLAPGPPSRAARHRGRRGHTAPEGRDCRVCAAGARSRCHPVPRPEGTSGVAIVILAPRAAPGMTLSSPLSLLCGLTALQVRRCAVLFSFSRDFSGFLGPVFSGCHTFEKLAVSFFRFYSLRFTFIKVYLAYSIVESEASHRPSEEWFDICPSQMCSWRHALPHYFRFKTLSEPFALNSPSGIPVMHLLHLL